MFDLKYLNEITKLNFSLTQLLSNSSKNQDEISPLIHQISSKISALREFTVAICFLYKKIKSQISTAESTGKFDFDKIANKFKFDKNYLIKMKFEMNAVKEGYMKYFFNVSEDFSPFLVKCSEKMREEENGNKGGICMHTVPMNEELKENIKICDYLILQELIGYQNRNDQRGRGMVKKLSPLKKFNYSDKDLLHFDSVQNEYNTNFKPKVSLQKFQTINQESQISRKIKIKSIRDLFSKKFFESENGNYESLN